jgi:tetratricopeptide (TPR) repeat protein
MAKRMPLDHRTDIYSLGATMYELLSFRPAFDSDDDKALIGSVITSDPPAPRKVNPAVPRELNTICLKAMEKSPDARYGSARLMADDLRRYLNDLPIVAKPPGPLQRAAKLVKRHKAVSLTFTMFVLLVVTVVSFFLVMRDRELSALIQHGVNLASAERWDEAEQELRGALEIDEHNAEALYALAWTKWRRFNQSRKRGDSNSELVAEIKDLCEATLAVEPGHDNAVNLIGIAYKISGDFERGIETFKRAIEMNPNGFPAWSNLGMMYALNRDLDASLEAYMHSTAIAATSTKTAVEPWRNLASVQMHLGELDAAERSLQKAVSCDGKNMATHLLRARLLLRQGHATKALVACGKADVEGKGEPMVPRLLALANLRLGQSADAVASAQEALTRGDMACINHLILSIAYAATGERTMAEQHLTEAERTWPAALSEAGDYIASAARGVLWFDTYLELADLRERASQAARPVTVPH